VQPEAGPGTLIMDRIELPRPLIEQMLAHSRANPDVEVCGLIAAIGGRAGRCIEVSNVSDTPECRFEMDPREQIDAFRSMRARGETLCAIYHSHPRSAARPSPLDLQLAAYPQALYIIVSMYHPAAPEIFAYRLDEGQARPVALDIHTSHNTPATDTGRDTSSPG
jgi:proteasome lid subunit RPN8/RPN11